MQASTAILYVNLIVTALFLFLATTACGPGDGVVSEGEKAERQKQAFDLKGSYLEDASGGSPARLDIVDETGRHDVVVTLDNPRGLEGEDRVALRAALRRDNPALADADLEEIVSRIVGALVALKLGEGQTFTPRGGENVVLDGVGDMSELALRKDLGSVFRDAANDYALTVSFFATAYRATRRLDYRTTAATDTLGKSVSGTKGLFITVTNMVREQDGTPRTRDVSRDQALRTGAFLKY